MINGSLNLVEKLMSVFVPLRSSIISFSVTLKIILSILYQIVFNKAQF